MVLWRGEEKGGGGQQFSIFGFKLVPKMILTADFETAVILKSPGQMLAENWMKTNNACPNFDETNKRLMLNTQCAVKRLMLNTLPRTVCGEKVNAIRYFLQLKRRQGQRGCHLDR